MRAYGLDLRLLLVIGLKNGEANGQEYGKRHENWDYTADYREGLSKDQGLLVGVLAWIMVYWGLSLMPHLSTLRGLGEGPTST